MVNLFREAAEPGPLLSIAGYPTRRVKLQFGDVHIELLTVDRLEDYVDAAAQLRDADAPEPPYWAHLWAGSRALAGLMAQADCAGRRVVDIGCGLGLAGLVAARRGASVTMCDLFGEALRFARGSIELNACRAGLVQMDLRASALRGRFDYCVAADVTYDPSLQAATAGFLAAHLARDGRAWCAESVRTLDQGFQQACTGLGMLVSERDVCEPDEGRDTRVRITEVRWR